MEPLSKRGSGEPDVDPRELLYISDLDGTLLSTDGLFSEDAAARLNRLIDCGLKFSIATARNHDSAHPILNGVNLKLPVILFNGVYLTDFHTGKNLHTSDFIEPRIMDEVVALVSPLGMDPFVYTFGEEHRVYYRSAGNPGARAYLDSLDNDTRLHHVREYRFSEKENISGFLLIHTKEALEPVNRTLREKYGDELNVYFAQDLCVPGYYWLQSYHQETNKGRMLSKLSQHLDIPLSRTVVFGDYLNDLCMFKMAGRAIAVANALPEVREAAHEIIGSNHEYAVIEYLESLGFEEGSNGDQK